MSKIPSQFPVGDPCVGPEGVSRLPPAQLEAGQDGKGYWDRVHVIGWRSAGPRPGLTMSRGWAVRRFLTSHWRTRPFLSRPGLAPPPTTARRPGAAGVDSSRRMLMRGRPPQPIGRSRSVGEVSLESQKNRAGPTAACSASGAGRAQPARPPGDPQGKPAPAVPQPELA